jgi:HAD superfamily hydrolase (TIGR01549 family)
VRELIERMRGEGLRLIVATSSAKDELQKLLDAALVSDLLEDRVSKDDVQGRSKPDPDIIELAIERIGLPPADLVMLGDTPYDVEAARRAWPAPRLSIATRQTFSCTTTRPRSHGFEGA